jgi:hypothetical protein
MGRDAGEERQTCLLMNEDGRYESLPKEDNAHVTPTTCWTMRIIITE